MTYQADLRGLAQKVLQEGATGRAQVLVRQIAQEGPVISRRLAYTVQRTSGALLWFGSDYAPRAIADYGLPPGPHPDFKIDHLIPLCLGGGDDPSNLRLCATAESTIGIVS